MKRTVLIGSIVGIVAVTSMMAQGFPGGICDGTGYGFGTGGPGIGGPGTVGRTRGFVGESVELTGRLQLAEGEIPTLASSGTEYFLRIHPALIDEIEVSDGATIQVEGELIEVTNPDLVSTDRVVFVRQLESDGNRYIAPNRPAFAGTANRRGNSPDAVSAPSRRWSRRD